MRKRSGGHSDQPVTARPVAAAPDLPDGITALRLAAAARSDPAGILHVARDELQGERLVRAAAGFAPDGVVVWLPPWDCLPYDRLSPSPTVMGLRLAALRRLDAARSGQLRLLLTTAEAAVQRLPPRHAWKSAQVRLARGKPLDAPALAERLAALGYRHDERVDEPGEMALRGSIVDLYPGGAAQPVRLELADGRLAAIRAYDPLSQRSDEVLEHLTIGPVSELLPATDGHDMHRMPRHYPQLLTVFDLLPDAAVSLAAGSDERIADWLELIAAAYATRQAQPSRAAAGPLPPDELYLDAAAWDRWLAGCRRLTLPPGDGRPAPELTTARKLRRFLRDREDAGERVAVVAAGAAERAQLVRLVAARGGVTPEALPDWPAFAAAPPPRLACLPLDLDAGFAGSGVVVLTARELLGRAAESEHRPDGGLAALPELQRGDVVVHRDHGIARLAGLDRLPDGGECLVLAYAGDERLLVPAPDIDRVWRYGSADAAVTLDRLTGESWHRHRASAEEELAMVAAALVRQARQRRETTAPILQPDPVRYRRVVRRFPWRETADQGAAVAAVMADLAAGRPMDRIVCGDVGFGKTEVAIRAIAAAVFAGHQAVVLAPTTVLARQHLDTFTRRFAGTGIRIAQLSRLVRAADARAVRQDLAAGTIDLAVGTHALAAPAVRFARLGLVVVDEEQRFGVRHKAALQALRQAVHTLTLTATPIPRTLEEALAGLRACSILATPPLARRPIRTTVLPFDPATVREALLGEWRRGGQSFVVCPRIADLEPMRKRLAALVPELDLAVAHGRLGAADLDDLMIGFAGGDHDVLLCTNIIESGLDIPNANTILIWRPDRFGLAELHQLRGRVGRGSRRAQAWLLLDPDTRPTAAARRRLATLQAFEALGAGFQISLHDLDQRGAGDLLGTVQAGHLRAIGLELYQHLLTQAIRRAGGNDPEPDWQPQLNLGIGFAVPEQYVPDPDARLALYRRMARLRGTAAVKDLAAECADRFGPVPPRMKALLAVLRLRERCRALDVCELECGPRGAAARFAKASALPPAAWLRRSGEPLVRQGDRLIHSAPGERPAQRLRAAGQLLAMIARIRSAED